ncbi:MAG: type II secretion system F family protein [Candidatus Micrarchaeota archaeon]
MLYQIGELAPKKLKIYISQLLLFAGMRMDPREWIGAAFITAISLSIFAHILLIVYSTFSPLLVYLLTGLVFVLAISMVYTLLYFQMEDRRILSERILPDLLQLTASNIRAGITPMVALRMATRPEFGPLHNEIIYITNKSLGSESFIDTLSEISKRIRSKVLARTILLFASSLRSGGSISKVLETSAEDIRENQELRRDLIAGTNMYVVFILFTVIIAMPALLTISIKFIDMVSEIQTSESFLSKQIGVGMSAPVSPDFIFMTSICTLVITSVLASLMIGVIHHGRELNGLRYAPLILANSIIFFYLAKTYLIGFILG